MATSQEPPPTFDSLYTTLTTTYNYPVLPIQSPKPHSTALGSQIAALSIHPCLESILHILNSDLPSAHFLCRHMQNAPAWEGMFIHGLLHRVEGDIENAKAWYGDVAESDVFRAVWPSGVEVARKFLDELKVLRVEGGDEEIRERLQEESRGEFDALVKWCKERFGVGKVEDATTVWVKPDEKHRAIAAKMVVGGEGWRQF